LPNRRDAADAWLDRVTAMLRVPASERDAIRAELNEHLRERIRDLMLSGAAEHAATSQAISELGDAAMLARRYQEAIEPSSRRSLMHVGIATAATAALVFSGAALFQGNATPPAPASGTGPAATAPVAVGALADAELTARMQEMYRALAESRDIIAKQERELARAHGEVESMQLRVRAAEERAAALQSENFEVHRQHEVAREDASRAAEELKKLTRERDAAMARVQQMQASIASVPPSPPATYVPPANAAWDALRAVQVDMSQAATLNAVMAQSAIRDAKVALAQPRIGEIELDPSGNVHLPDRPLNLAEILEAVNTGIASPSLALVPRDTPDGRIMIAPQEAWDRADQVLVIYDLSDIAERDRARSRTPSPFVAASSVHQLHNVITKTVTPTLWQDNGGDLATISTIDASLVITAPERSHHQIRWIIEQMRSSSSRVEVPILSDLPLVGVMPVEARDRRAISPVRNGKPAPVEVKGEPGK
jgi:hypothetical protein